MSSHALWFATRGTGVVSLILLTAIVVLGVAGATRWRSTRWPRFVVAGLHRNLTLLALVFIALHVITTVADGYAPISLPERGHPLHIAVPAGVARSRRGRVRPPARADDHEPAARPDRLCALAGPALARVRLVADRARARARHRHGCARHLDADRRPSPASPASSSRSSGASRRDRATPALRTFGTIAAIAAPLVIGGWYLAGPARPGWAARAGTPRSLLPHSTTTSIRGPRSDGIHPEASDPVVHGNVQRSCQGVVAGLERSRAREHLRPHDAAGMPACSGSGCRASRWTAAACR